MHHTNGITDMQTIDLKHIAETADIKTNKLGELLFPDNLDPYSAVMRVMRGRGLLNSEQIAKLADYLNVNIDFLFENVDWRKSVEAGSDRITFKKHDFEAGYHTKHNVTFLWHGGVFVDEIEHDKDIKMSEYFKSLTDLIIKNR